jgi:flagellar motor protein MotB
MRAARVSALAALTFVALAALPGCGAKPPVSPRFTEMDGVRGTPAAKEAAALAPQAFARAENERLEAHKAEDAKDDVAAAIDADRAIAAYGHAFALARLARAEQALDEAKAQLAQASQRARELAASRAQVDAEGEELEKRLTVAREAAPIVPSAGTDAQREAARYVAARGLLTEARLLCGSARLVSDTAPGVAEAEKEVATLDAQLDAKPRPVPIDAAARARARCLESLTLARRAAPAGADSVIDADALLAELSASGGLAPSRDERGVVVTLRDVFEGTTANIAAPAQARLAELGRVAAAHPGVGVQVVVHSAAPPAKGAATTQEQRADAVSKALVAAGAPAGRVKSDAAGARNPVVDPNDAPHRARNERVEVVFVTR